MFDAGARGGRTEAVGDTENEAKGMRYKVFIPTGEHEVFFIDAANEDEAITQAEARSALGGMFAAIEYVERSDHDPPFAVPTKVL